MPEALFIACEGNFAGFGGIDDFLGFGGNIATVFEDPSIDASHVEITRIGSPELVIRGTGFNNKARPAMDFDPPLDSANLNVHVSSHENPVA